MSKRCIIFDVDTGQALCSMSARNGKHGSDQAQVDRWAHDQLANLARANPGREFVATDIATPRGRDHEILHQGIGRIRATIHRTPSGALEIYDVLFATGIRINATRTRGLPRYEQWPVDRFRPRILASSKGAI